MANLKKSLREKALEMQQQLPIMQGKEKGESEDLIGTIVSIDDFDFLNGENGEYAVFTIREDDSHFFFGGKVLSEKLKTFQTEGYTDLIKIEGLPMVLSTKKSSKGRSYTAVTFYPEG